MLIAVNSLRAEILWILKVVTSHFSLPSCLGLNELFRIMLLDSKIASSFQSSKTKCSYFINYGLAPYFKELLLQDVKVCPFFVLSFGESLNELFKRNKWICKYATGTMPKIRYAQGILTRIFCNALMLRIYAMS